MNGMCNVTKRNAQAYVVHGGGRPLASGVDVMAWVSGKTSLMTMLKHRLGQTAESDKTRDHMRFR